MKRFLSHDEERGDVEMEEIVADLRQESNKEGTSSRRGAGYIYTSETQQDERS